MMDLVRTMAGAKIICVDGHLEGIRDNTKDFFIIEKSQGKLTLTLYTYDKELDDAKETIYELNCLNKMAHDVRASKEDVGCDGDYGVDGYYG